MKRSEMVQRLVDAVYEQLDAGILISDSEGDDLLRAIEKAGMLPPTVIFHATGGPMSAKQLLKESKYDAGFEWEPE